MKWSKIGKLVGKFTLLSFLLVLTALGSNRFRAIAINPEQGAAPQSEAQGDDSGINSSQKTEGMIEVTQLAGTFKSLPRRNLQEFINLQRVVDQWRREYGSGTVAVEIYDVDYHTIAASLNSSAVMSPRSLYKLFYTYDGYAQIDAGQDDANQIYLNGMTLGYCLDIMIRQSNNPCAEQMLENDPPRLARVGQLIQRLGLANTQADGLRTSAHDISLLLQHYYAHPEWSASSWQKFRASALNQASLYRRGLPSGFSEATVYDKAGWGGTTYNDAAMVEFVSGGQVRQYIMVVMTDGSSTTAISRLGMMLEKAILYK